MWTCPKCGRDFKKTNQGHYCGKAPESVDEYIALQIPEAKKQLDELRCIIRTCIPEVEEKIAWSMPVFKKGNSSISMAACKKHISLYLDTEMIELFKQQSNEFIVRKNAIYLPYDKKLPTNIIENTLEQYFQDKPL